MFSSLLAGDRSAIVTPTHESHPRETSCAHTPAGSVRARGGIGSRSSNAGPPTRSTWQGPER